MSPQWVLVVEDDESIRRALIDYVGEHAHVQVDGARDGVDALHKVLTRRYDIVILDMMMPKMSGGDFLDSLKAMISDPSLNFQGDPPEIIVVTAAPPEDLPSATIEDRFPDLVRAVLRKPLDFELLMSALGRP
ncbi:MAG TPA: response regulator [Thermoanaerobaculia bacterium]|nr:response regulator [Thermoanaerobaculia bacterium]